MTSWKWEKMRDDRIITFPKYVVFITIVIVFLLVRNLITTYNLKSELSVIKTNSWNAYDSADACYQKVRLVWDDVESIFYRLR